MFSIIFFKLTCVYKCRRRNQQTILYTKLFTSSTLKGKQDSCVGTGSERDFQKMIEYKKLFYISYII